MIDKKWNFETITNLVQAASFAQDAGESEKCNELLLILAGNINSGAEK